MKKAKTKTLITILTAAIILLTPIAALAVDPPLPAAKTGQTLCYDEAGAVISCEGTGQDGEYQTGVASPNPRFTDNTDGTVTDEKTGLVWLKNANCFGEKVWVNALTDSNALNSGECGLTDGSDEGDWRLPNKVELESLLDMAYSWPAISNTAGTAKWTEGNPFTGVQKAYYWSSNTNVGSPSNAWDVSMAYGRALFFSKTLGDYVWPVRGPDRDDDGLDDHEDNCPTVSNADQKDIDSNNIGDVCDPNTVYGTMSGDAQSGIYIDITLISCGETSQTITTQTNAEGYYAVGNLLSGKHLIKPYNSSYVFNPVIRSVVIPRGNAQAYNFVATEIPICDGGARFLDNGDGTVTDCRTDLVWLKNANCFGYHTWEEAMLAAAGLNNGECGLSDGSAEDDWRMPTKEELQGIGTNPPITWDFGSPPYTWTRPGLPFTGVQSDVYWSSTSYGISADRAYCAWGQNGDTTARLKTEHYYIWPVRAGN